MSPKTYGFAFFLPLALCVSCQTAIQSAEERPIESITWEGRGGGFLLWGRGADCLYGVSVQPAVLDVWKWDRGSLKKSMQTTFDRKPPSLALTTHETLVYHDNASSMPKDERTGVIRVRHMEKVRPPIELDADQWYTEISQPSRCGVHLAVWAKPEFNNPDFGLDKNIVRVGMISHPDFGRINWVIRLTGSIPVVTIPAAIPSDDGLYIALAGWQHGATVIDVARKRLLWQRRPKDEVCFNDIAFSPGSDRLYAGGGEGCVYGMDAKTGDILSRWFASDSGTSEYGHRITSIAVSADGRLVAAGTGPEGIGYVYSVETGKLVRRVVHGGGTILVASFSPDSTRLATFVPGSIKIWSMPRAEGNGEKDPSDKSEANNKGS
jgi:WD40 repeat protein